jgi:hypothetical protein
MFQHSFVMKEKVKDPRIKSLVAEVAQGRQAEILEEMVETVLRFGKDKLRSPISSFTIGRCVSCGTHQLFLANIKGSARWPFSAALG